MSTRSLARLAAIVVLVQLTAPMSGGYVSASEEGPHLQLIESWPAETDLDNRDIPDAPGVWLTLIRNAQSSLDFAEFYASAHPTGEGRLEEIIVAIEEAARRGVRVRFLTEEKFYGVYPEVVDRLARSHGIAVRRLDSAAFDGGVLHAKYFIVDRETIVLGSQNFDWRALEHIQELGVVSRDPGIVDEIQGVYELDWEIAGRIAPGSMSAGSAVEIVDSLVAAHAAPSAYPGIVMPNRGAYPPEIWTRPALSPVGRLPDDSLWDEPLLVELINSSRDSLFVQLLTYDPVGRDRDYFEVLENALRDAAARGVEVQILLADWCMRSPTIDYLKSLTMVPGVEVRLMSIPPFSGGFIPYARVSHAKYMVVDAEEFWIGTSNWSRDYFHASRNVGIVGGGGDIGARLARYFLRGWNSPYCEAIRPEIEYAPPRISD